jgi:hypothetical protein
MTDLDAIRERHKNRDAQNPERWSVLVDDRRALLAYIDGLAEAVEGLPILPLDPSYQRDVFDVVDRAAVLAILRGDTR